VADRRHRRECPRLAFDYVLNYFMSGQAVVVGLMRQGRHEAAEVLNRKFMAVGETSLGHRVGMDETVSL
jgi:hypothetical protein